MWDSNFIVCNATIGQAGAGQVTITASSGGVNATLTAYIHEKVDRVVANVVYPTGNCYTMGQVVTTSASAFNTSDPGCSPTAPCDITSTVGPIAISSNDPTIASNSTGIEPTYSSATDTPTYQSGGTIAGSSGQTCNLSNFTAGNASGIDPTYSLATNSPTYTSGGAFTGNVGQTCSLSNFNGVTGATATVALTGTDAIASGTHLTITSEGSGGITPPTTATLGNGTATCSGTANVITALNTNIGLGFSVVDAAATVTLTGANTIAFGTHLNVTASGYGATTPPTTATLSNGTATCSGSANVHTALTSAGVFTAENPGSTTVFGSVSGVNSVAVPYLTCPVASIKVHDANSSNVSFTLAVGGTQPLTADVFDTKGQYIKPSITWGSSAIASVKAARGTTGDNPATLTGVAPGTAYITATCSDPDCNKNVGAQYSLNVATAAVPGGTTTTVYAASSHSLSLVPISTSTNTAGTPITLPFPPTSIVVDPTGTTVYLGSASSGLMAVNVSTGVVTTYSVFGAIEAISPDANYLLVSYPPLNSLYYFNASTLTTVFTQAGETTNSGAFTPDGKLNEWLSGSQLGVVIPAVSRFTATTLGYTGNALDISGQGGLTYITAATPNGIDVRSTCDQSDVQSFTANTPTLIKAIPNGTGAVAADSPAIDVVTTGTVQAGCPVAAPNSVTSFDLGAGPFDARQIFLSSNSSAAWIVSDLPELLLFDLKNSIPYTIPYTGGATAYNGGITLDGTQVYLGGSDGAVHRIDVASHTDAQQIAVGLKDGSGNPVSPNLVYVVP